MAGALPEAELRATVVAAGCVGFQITWHGDVFAGAEHASSASQFGTHGINFDARKARDDDEWTAALAELSCAVG